MSSNPKSKKTDTQYKRCFGSIYKTVAQHQLEKCQIEYGKVMGNTNFYIQIGKVITYNDSKITQLWMFRENIDDEILENRQVTFDKIYLTAQENNQPFISKYEVSKHVYVYNGVKYSIEKDESVPFVQNSVETDFLADFLCENQPLNLRFVCEKYKTMKTNAPTTKYYDSIHEQHTVVYKFYDAITVHFIIEFDITRDNGIELVENSKINRILIEIDKQLDFDNEESKGLFEQILSLIVFGDIREAHPHTYNLIRKYTK